MDKIKQQLNKLTSEVKGLKKENKELLSKITKLEKRIPLPEKIDTRVDQEIYDEVVKDIMERGEVSTSYIQRKFWFGYSRASYVMDALEDNGVIGPSKGAEPRDVLIK